MALQTSSQFGEGGDEIDLGDILRALQRQWLTIAAFTIIGAFIGLFLLLTASPVFTLDGSLYFGEGQLLNTPSDSNGNELLTTFQSVTDVPTEVDLLQSRALIEQAILETGLNVEVHPQGTTAMSYWRWRFGDDESIQAYAPTPADIIVQYATLFDPGDEGEFYSLQFGDGGNYKLLSSDESALVLSGIVNQPAAGHGVTLLIKTALGGPPPAKGSVYSVYITPAKSLADDMVGGPLNVAQGGSTTAPTQTADVTLDWKNPYRGQIFVNQLMRDFIATQLSWKTESASDTEQFVSDQLQKIQSNLQDADNKLAAYQSQTGIMDVPTNAQAVVGQLSAYQTQRSAALLEEQALQQLVKATNAPDKGLNPYLVTEASDPVLGQLASNLATAEVQMQTQRVQFTPASPEVQALQATIDRTQAAIRTLLRNDETLAAGNVANLDTLIAKYQDQLKAIPAQSLQITELTRASDVFGQLYVLLMQNEEEAEVSKAATIVDTRIVSPAEVPLYATKPKGGITVLAGLVLGLIAGTALVLIRRVTSGRFHSEGDVRRSVPLPIYGLIPSRSKRDLSAGVFADQSRSAFAESFRLLRSRLYQVFTPQDGKASIILVTSASANDGKTTIAANLAGALGDDGKRVLLMDADLHRGHLHEALRIGQAPGLAEWLGGKKRPPLQAVTGQNFSALPAGIYPANPSELLNETTLGTIFPLLRAEFDVIIIDSPPLPSVADTLALAKFADVIISVLFIERTKRVLFNAHLDTFGDSDVPRGVVINGLLTGAHTAPFAYGAMRAMPGGLRRFLPGGNSGA